MAATSMSLSARAAAASRLSSVIPRFAIRINHRSGQCQSLIPEAAAKGWSSRPLVAGVGPFSRRLSSSTPADAAPPLASPPPSPPWSPYTSAPRPPPPDEDLPPDFLPSIQSSLPSLKVSTNKYDLDAHGRGESYHPSVPPRAVLTPTSTEEVSIIVQHCSDYGVPIIPWGAGTSLEGHVSALRGGVSLDMSSFAHIEMPLDEDGTLTDAHVKVGAGVTRKTLNDALRHTGMMFMVDPGADASIGGMVACGASGTAAVKYGTMRENVLGLEIVLPDGTVAKTGTDGAVKNSAGYDLTALMCGSEGTLGIITSVTVKLHPVPPHVTAAVCGFDDLHSAAEAVTVLRTAGVDVERCELLDATSIEAFNAYASKNNQYAGLEMAVRPTLFLEFAGPSPASVEEKASIAREACVEFCGGSDFTFTSSEDERRRLWSARHRLYYASLALRPGCDGAIITDACVPLSKFPDLIASTARDVREKGVVGPCFGHAGDGNFHCILPVKVNAASDGENEEEEDEEYLRRVHEVNDAVIRRTLEAGGTCTGEHGVGYGKIKYLPVQYGEGGVDFMRRIKRGIDPKNIMNPGKIVDVQ